MPSDDWSEKPPPEHVYADVVYCHWCGHPLSQHTKPGKACTVCPCQHYMARSVVRREGVSLLVTRLLEATEACEWPLGWKLYAKATHLGPAEYDLVLCDKTPVVGHDKNGIPYCKRHVPADFERDTVPEEPEKD